MTARQNKPPLSRRQLRENADEAASDAHGIDGATESEGPTANAPVPTPGRRRVRWDPAAASVPAAADDTDVSAPAPPPTTSTAPAATGDESGTTATSFRERDFRPDARRSSFAPAFVTGEMPARAEPSAAGETTGPETTAAEAGAEVGIGSPAVGDTRVPGSDGGARDDLDLAAPERTMTRRELRILRARAEAAGLPAPDVMFGPNGESTVTGAIPVLDGEAFRPASAPDADAAGVVTEKPIAEAGPAGSTATAPQDPEPSDHEPSDPGPSGPVSADSEATLAGEGTAQPQVIPALVEPDVAGGTRFPSVSDPAVSDPPAEIVVDAEPATGDHPLAEAGVGPVGVVDMVAVDPVAPQADESASGGTVSDQSVTDQSAVTQTLTDQTDADGPPAPGRLRPFDAMFLPPSARTDDDVLDPLDTASAQPVNDSDGLRGDILAAPAGAPRPFGHWSTQDEDDDTGETMLTRGVGTGVVTTHALVLPSIPDAGEPLLSPLTSTGEVMVTGIVELPKSYGSTGAHPALFDHSEVDSLIDDSDREDVETGAAPVRATRAVSSTTTTRSMVETAPTKRSRVLPIIAIAVGGIVLVAAASWAIAAIFFNAF